MVPIITFFAGLFCGVFVISLLVAGSDRSDLQEDLRRQTMEWNNQK